MKIVENLYWEEILRRWPEEAVNLFSSFQPVGALARVGYVTHMALSSARCDRVVLIRLLPGPVICAVAPWRTFHGRRLPSMNDPETLHMRHTKYRPAQGSSSRQLYVWALLDSRGTCQSGLARLLVFDLKTDGLGGAHVLAATRPQCPYV